MRKARVACTLLTLGAVVLGLIAGVEPPHSFAAGAFAGAVVNGNGKDLANAGQVLRLNDAFNSNPVGFSAALDVLKELPGGKKVLVTPGMIELGERQAEENERMAKKAAALCDLVIVVGKTNRDALVSGLQSGGISADKFLVQDTMQEALRHLAKSYLSDGDVVLIENDLSDLYESNPKF